MNITEAKILILIKNLAIHEREPFFIAARLEKSHSAIYNYCRLLLASGKIRKIKRGSKAAVYEITDDKYFDSALKKINGGD
jgi:predicted transcriptional regulator